MAVFTLRNLGRGAEQAIPFLIQCLTNTDATIRDEAAIALGFMHLQPEACVPALTAYLKSLLKSDRVSFELDDAIAALREHGTNSVAALPVLRPLLDHEKPEVRQWTTNALRAIQPGGDWSKPAQ